MLMLDHTFLSDTQQHLLQQAEMLLHNKGMGISSILNLPLESTVNPFPAMFPHLLQVPATHQQLPSSLMMSRSSAIDQRSVKIKSEPGPILSLNDTGGLSDNDETRGDEWEAAINNPPKGKNKSLAR